MSFFTRNDVFAFSKKKYFVCSGIIFLSYFIYLFNSGYDLFYYDSLDYWNFGAQFIQNGNFSLLNFGESNRGCMFPLVNMCLIWLASVLSINDIIIFKCFSALLIAISFGFLLPKTFARLSGKEITSTGILLFNTIVFCFWRDYFNFPLSDFISVYLLIFCIYCATNISYKHALFFGVALAFLINMRPVYLLSSLPLLVLFFTAENTTISTKLRLYTFIIIAFILTSLPQAYINLKIWNAYSLVQPTEKFYNGESLYMKQLRWGIAAEKYETNVGSCYPQPKVFFFSPWQDLIFDEGHISLITNYSEYSSLVLRHPFLFTVLYTKHFFNGMDIKYATPYVSTFKNNTVLSLFNYTLLFLAALYLLTRKFSPKIIHLLILVSLLLPVLLAIPTAIEVRFFLPVYLLIYLINAYYFLDIIKALRQYFKGIQTAGIILTAYVVFLVFCYWMSDVTRHLSEFEFSC